ncbi:hypothetical protein [Spirosoma migulaei]
MKNDLMNIVQLKSIMSKKTSNDFSCLSNCLLPEISQPSSLINILESIMCEEKELDRVAKSSFIHNLGFIRVNIIGWDVSSYMLKLHIWNLPKINIDIKNGNEFTIHNHLYDFSSSIITGCLNFDIYSESDNGISMEKYINPLKEDEYIFEYIGTRALKKQLQVNLSSGSQYLLDHQTLHFVSAPPNICTSTLCLQSPICQRETLIYSQNKLRESLPKSVRFNSSSLKKVIKNYLKVLE